MKLAQFGQPHDGVLVAFCGPEGAGKTTAIRKLVRLLVDEGYPVLYVKEPGDATAFGQDLRTMLFDSERYGDLATVEEFFLLVASRAHQMRKVIEPHLATGGVVISDRAFPASYAYQGGEVPQLLPVMDALHHQIIRCRYDLIAVVDVSDEVSRIRQAERGTTNRIEEYGHAFHSRVNQRYREMARDNDLPVVDGNKSPQKIVQQMLNLVRPLLSRYADLRD